MQTLTDSSSGLQQTRTEADFGCTWEPEDILRGLLRGVGIVAAQGGLRDKRFRRSTIEKMLKVTKDGTKFFETFPMLGPAGSNPRRLEWGAAWVFTRNLAAIDMTEATLLPYIIATSDQKDLWDILRASG